METKLLVIGGGVGLGLLVLLSKGSSQRTGPDYGATLASQQIAAGQDAALGVASMELQNKANEINGGLAGVKLQMIDSLYQNTLMMISADKTQTINLMGNIDKAANDASTAALAYSSHYLDTKSAEKVAFHTISAKRATESQALNVTYGLGKLGFAKSKLDYALDTYKAKLGYGALKMQTGLAKTEQKNDFFLENKSLDIGKTLSLKQLQIQANAEFHAWKLAKKQIYAQQKAQNKSFITDILGMGMNIIDPLNSPGGQNLVSTLGSVANNSISSGTALAGSMMNSTSSVMGGSGGGGGNQQASGGSSGGFMDSIMKMAPMIAAMFI